MKGSVRLDARITQERFAQLVGLDQSTVSRLISDGVLDAEQTAGAWVQAYCQRLREQAAGRMADGGASLVKERAALARSQREAQDLKNAVDRGEYAPIGLLADVLGAASSAVVDRFDQLDGALRKTCPDLPESARAALQTVIASARNEWIRATASLIDARLDEQEDEEGDQLAESDA